MCKSSADQFCKTTAGARTRSCDARGAGGRQRNGQRTPWSGPHRGPKRDRLLSARSHSLVGVRARGREPVLSHDDRRLAPHYLPRLCQLQRQSRAGLFLPADGSGTGRRCKDAPGGWPGRGETEPPMVADHPAPWTIQPSDCSAGVSKLRAGGALLFSARKWVKADIQSRPRVGWSVPQRKAAGVEGSVDSTIQISIQRSLSQSPAALKASSAFPSWPCSKHASPRSIRPRFSTSVMVHPFRVREQIPTIRAR
jgi:hypothetical protein